jgi:hypothetical protein
LATYLALCWNASDCESETFRIAKGALAQRTGLGRRTIAGCLLELERLGLIHIARSKSFRNLNELNTYTLTSMAGGNAPNALGVVQGMHYPHAPNARGPCKGRQPSHARNQNNSEDPSGLLRRNKVEAAQAMAAALPRASDGAGGGDQAAPPEASQPSPLKLF